MRLLVLCEEPPDRSPTGNGSSMISANVLARLPPDVEVHLAHGEDGRRVLDAAVEQRCASVLPLTLPSRRRSALAAPFTRLPRATWRVTRASGYEQLRARAAECDVLLVHGLHAFALARRLTDDVPLPVVVQEVDDWSEHWREEASTSTGLRARYLVGQARRAARLEQATAQRVQRYLVVAPAEAERLARRLGRPVLAVPNGVARPAPPAPAGDPAHHDDGATDVIGFLGTLDYPPNIEAVERLCCEVLPLVRREVPTATVRIAGRRPSPEVLRLAGPFVHVVGPVPEPAAFYRSAAVVAYVGATGTGTKNTVLEALACGAAVVASTESSRSVPSEGQLVVGGTSQELASQVVVLLRDAGRRRELGVTARRWAAGLPDWELTARRYADVLHSVMPASAEGPAAASS